MADTGLRVGELVALDVGDLEFDAERPHIYLSSDKQKGWSGDATVYLNDWSDFYDATDTLKQYLARHGKDAEVLFPSRQSDRMMARSVEQMVTRPAMVGAATPQMKTTADNPTPSDVTPYTFRHSVAYRIIVAQGGRLKDVQRHLCHASRETTD